MKNFFFFFKILWNGRVAVVVQDYLVEHQQWWIQVVVVEDVSVRKRAKILIEVLLDPALSDSFFIQRHIYFIYHFLPKFNFKKLKEYYKSSQFFVLKLYHTYSLRHMFYLLGKLSLRATQSLWNGNNWRTSIMGSENNKRIYISYTYTMLKYGTSKAFSQSITLKRVKQVKN